MFSICYSVAYCILNNSSEADDTYYCHVLVDMYLIAVQSSLVSLLVVSEGDVLLP